MSKLLYQGHGSYRIITNENVVIYIDPFAGKGYDKEADIILVTHQHFDHCDLDKVPKKDTTKIIQNFDGLKNDKYNSFNIKSVNIKAVPAYNEHHSKMKCVGYILDFDKIRLYASGDTGKIKEMKDLKDKHLDYAFLPIDDKYTMSEKEAYEVSKEIKARHTVPIHLVSDAVKLYDEEKAQRLKLENKLIIRENEEIKL